jgi:hypothetical protein
MLTSEEIEKIKAQEALRRQIVEELIGPKAPDQRKGRVLAFLNSDFGKWLVPTIATAVIPFVWSYYDPFRIQKKLDQEKQLAEERMRQDKEVAMQREDSEFLTELLPALAGPDQRMLKRTILVIQARYPSGKIPGGVQRLLAAVALDTLSSTLQFQQLAVRALDNIPTKQLDPTVSATIKALGTVYFQIYDEQQRLNAKRISNVLSRNGFLVLGIENVGARADPINTVEVRYFPADTAKAQGVKRILEQEGITRVNLRMLNLKTTAIRSSQPVEVWFSAPGKSNPSSYHDKP